VIGFAFFASMQLCWSAQKTLLVANRYSPTVN
jgi:hypothetical protein